MFVLTGGGTFRCRPTPALCASPSVGEEGGAAETGGATEVRESWPGAGGATEVRVSWPGVAGAEDPPSSPGRVGSAGLSAPAGTTEMVAGGLGEEVSPLAAVEGTPRGVVLGDDDGDRDGVALGGALAGGCAPWVTGDG